MKARTIARLLLSWMVALAWSATASAQGHSIAVVVSPQNETSNVTVGELRKIFAGEKRSWPGGAKVKLFTRMPGTLEHAALLKQLRMSESEYQQYWTAMVYRGDAESSPLVVPSNGMQKEALGVFPGAIALMDAADVKAGMKVLRIDGKLPTDADYPLRQ